MLSLRHVVGQIPSEINLNIGKLAFANSNDLAIAKALAAFGCQFVDDESALSVCELIL